LVAHHGPVPFGPIGEFSFPLVRETVAGRTVLEKRIVHVADLQSERDEFPRGSEFARRMGFRTALCVPLMREGIAIGTLDLRRTEARPFTEQQVALLQTFADQAVIAIENVRLFTEVQEKNRALTQAHAQVTETLEQQTATSEILRTISSSLTDVQPVFNTIVQSGLRLLGGYSASMMLLRDDDRLDLVAYTSTSAEADSSLVDAFPMPLRRIPP